MDLTYSPVFEPTIVWDGREARQFTVTRHRDPATGNEGIHIAASESTKRWASTANERGHGRAQVLGFIVDLLKQYQADRPVYRGIALSPWERELADHEHTLESVAAYFVECLRGNFTKERIVVDFDRGNELEPLPEELTPAYKAWEFRRLVELTRMSSVPV